MPLGLAVFLLGLGVSGMILFGLFLFYAHAFADEAAREGRDLPPRVAGLVKALDQESTASVAPKP
jgi:hypothetical protein